LPILKGVVDALEIGSFRQDSFATQEWYRYLNCGYKVAVCGGTDKMGAYAAIGWMRTYAKLDPNKPFTYYAWRDAVRAGKTVSTNGPLLDLSVDSADIGDTIKMSENGGVVEVQAAAESFLPIGRLEIVYNGKVVASEVSPKGAKNLKIKTIIKICGSGWIAARCSGHANQPAGYGMAHTSPVYIKCGETRAFDAPAAQHMLALVDGGIEYLNTIATAFDEQSRKRMVKLFKEAQQELKGRILVESKHKIHSGNGHYHVHSHDHSADHKH